MSKSRDIADSAATINYIDGLTSDAQGQIDTATSDIATNASDIATKAPLSNPTFTGTVTATAFSGDGSGLTGVDSLPSQTGNNGLFLTTDGSTASWAEAGGGAWELLSTTTISGNPSTLAYESIINSSYSSYRVYCEDLVPSTGTILNITLKKSGAYLTSNYYSLNINSTSSSVDQSANQSKIELVPIDTGGNATSCIVEFSNLQSSLGMSEVITAAGNGDGDRRFWSVHSNKTSGSCTGFRFGLNSGTFASGTIYVYGLKNSQEIHDGQNQNC